MTDVLIRFDTEAEPRKVIDALTSSDGIRSFWTSNADTDDEEARRVAFTWGLILARLKELVETARAEPVFG